ADEPSGSATRSQPQRHRLGQPAVAGRLQTAGIRAVRFSQTPAGSLRLVDVRNPPRMDGAAPNARKSPVDLRGRHPWQAALLLSTSVRHSLYIERTADPDS